MIIDIEFETADETSGKSPTSKFTDSHFLSALTSGQIGKQRLKDMQNDISELMKECTRKNSKGEIIYPAYEDTTVDLSNALFLVNASLQRFD